MRSTGDVKRRAMSGQVVSVSASAGMLDLPPDALLLCHVELPWRVVCASAQACKGLNRELSKDSLWRNMFVRRWGLEAANCDHGCDCSCRFENKQGWTPVAKQSAGQSWRVAFQKLHERAAAVHKEVEGTLGLCMDAVLCPRVLEKELVFSDVEQLLETLMRMVRMSAAVDVPVSKSLDTSICVRLYSIVYAMCTSRRSDCADDIYRWFCRQANRYISDVVEPAVNRLSGKEKAAEIRAQSTKFRTVASYLSSKVASYLNRYHTTANNLQSIETHWIQTFDTWKNFKQPQPTNGRRRNYLTGYL